MIHWLPACIRSWPHTLQIALSATYTGLFADGWLLVWSTWKAYSLVNQVYTLSINDKTREDWGIVCSTPKFHPLLTSFYIGFKHACSAVRIVLLDSKENFIVRGEKICLLGCKMKNKCWTWSRIDKWNHWWWYELSFVIVQKYKNNIIGG